LTMSASTAQRWAGAAGRYAYSLLPLRKTVVRSCLFSMLGMLPFFLIALIKVPHIFVPILLALFYAAKKVGLVEDAAKQLRWARKMSARGPIFWAAAAGQRLSVRLGRKAYGGKLDVLPPPLKAIGTKTRSSTHAKIEWIPGQLTSSFSVQAFDVQVRPLALAEADSEGGWLELVDGHTETSLVLKPLTPETAYEARVRASNSKGSSPWKTLSFVTKQTPLQMEYPGSGGVGGGGGRGPCLLGGLQYRWLQNLKDQSMLVLISPLDATTKAWQVDVSFRPSHLKVTLNGKALLDGELPWKIVPDDCAWELSKTTVEGEVGPELQLSLVKAKQQSAEGKEDKEPLWNRLLKGHPEVDMSKVKREDKSLEEIMAELQAADPGGMDKVQQMKKEL